MKKKLIACICIALLAGCATSYQPYSYLGGGGYRDVQLAENVFKVTVEANGYTSSERATNLALLRSAELTKQHGFKYFVIGESVNEIRAGTYTTPTTTNLQISRYGNTAYGNAQTYGGQTYMFSFPTPSMTITCFTGKPIIQATVYDADIVIKSLKSQLGVE
jgi:hypothetical protein